MFEVKKDCFAYRNEKGREKCIALKQLYCKCEKCNFYKKKEQLNGGRKNRS